ncbi:MAG: Spx/MgsR family RNA polymerase-binding regulatory protein [Alkalinema sp. RU_4_3]|nr:Spx/MgsR family RNA polymerase-binding regulatory protein [Alkalinema sp. RU_4_3]
MLEVYGIPTCSTCQKALKWLESQAIPYQFINTKETAPSQPQITQWVQTLGNKPLRNTSGLSYRALGATKDSWQDPDWIKAFSNDAMLLKRPLFVQGDTAIHVGFRDPEVLLASMK